METTEIEEEKYIFGGWRRNKTFVRFQMKTEKCSIKPVKLVTILFGGTF